MSNTPHFSANLANRAIQYQRILELKIVFAENAKIQSEKRRKAKIGKSRTSDSKPRITRMVTDLPNHPCNSCFTWRAVQAISRHHLKAAR